MKDLLAVGEIMLYPFYILPALLGLLLAAIPVAVVGGKGEWLGDAFMSIVDPTDGLK